ncbi:MAG: heme-copper oxidase subunit III [Acidimicrobiia bacterium]|nr:MAG: heme-copper oxidase subunit III [Acidimicrobiia bacterium]
MAVATDDVFEEYEESTEDRLDRTRKTAMWIWLGSEVFFFGAMISTFLLYRNSTNGGPGAEIFNIPFTSASSFILLMSSLTMVLADSAFSRRDQRQGRIWLIGTAGLGLTFLAGQIFEFTEFVDQGLTLSTSPFGSAFYLLTGFHGAHVAIGVLMLAMLIAFSLQGRLSPDHGMNVELVALYWHFVDIVWIVIFTVVYLIQI